MNSLTPHSSGFRLQLANGFRWRLTATPAASPWLAEFASILGLTVDGSGEPNAHIRFRATEAGDPAPDLSGLGRESISWDHYDMGVVLDRSKGDIWVDVAREESLRDEIYHHWAMVQPFYRFIADQGGVPLHAALVERQGVGILVSAPGGTGKTTTFHRLPENWGKLTDDETLAVQMEDGSFNIHPFPTWSRFFYGVKETTWQVEQSLPLGAILFLKQDDRIHLERIGQAHAAVLIHQASRHLLLRSWALSGEEEEKRLKRLAVDISADLAKQLPAYFLHLPLEGDFAEPLEAFLAKEGVLSTVPTGPRIAPPGEAS